MGSGLGSDEGVLSEVRGFAPPMGSYNILLMEIRGVGLGLGPIPKMRCYPVSRHFQFIGQIFAVDGGMSI